MPDTPYSKRELDTFFREIKEHLDSQDSHRMKQGEVLEKILEQTTRTNGRVNRLEWWKSSVIWGMGAIITVVTVLSPFIWDGVKLAMVDTINNSINKTFSKYNIEVQ